MSYHITLTLTIINGFVEINHSHELAYVSARDRGQLFGILVGSVIHRVHAAAETFEMVNVGEGTQLMGDFREGLVEPPTDVEWSQMVREVEP